ncbi:hypothetical protein MHF_0556 [Mycoplasma haemofelis Ohio2]|uniref:Uncharacterized protein n=1 Tax=Mycoplasma haemofelis (strain Ohio2) TaxID=859194 RepID=F6FHY0_MYCHI|nr:hypothetical protein MHF_0556 [Mycoplasma haemofelis Ohio2]
MSIKKWLAGLGGVGTTSAGIWFGMSQKQSDDQYKVKLAKYRGVAKEANQYLHKWYVKLSDPENKSWKDKFNYYQSVDWQYERKDWKDMFPVSTPESEEAMKDFCFKMIEENMDDLRKDKINIDNGVHNGKQFWDICTSTSS